MFSTSTIASSTTAPMAIARPANVITLRVAPSRESTSREHIKDNGMMLALINAIRHSNRNSRRTTTTSRLPASSDPVRLSIDISINVAGRKMVVSIS